MRRLRGSKPRVPPPPACTGCGGGGRLKGGLCNRCYKARRRRGAGTPEKGHVSRERSRLATDADREAFTRVVAPAVERHARRVFRLSRCRDDLVAEAVMVAWMKFLGRKEPTEYLGQQARNAVCYVMRGHARRCRVTDLEENYFLENDGDLTEKGVVGHDPTWLCDSEIRGLSPEDLLDLY